jgi:hypothetical protein
VLHECCHSYSSLLFVYSNTLYLSSPKERIWWLVLKLVCYKKKDRMHLCNIIRLTGRLSF